MSDRGSPAPSGDAGRSPSGSNARSPPRRSRSRSPAARNPSPKRRDPDDVEPEAVNPGTNIYIANLPHRLKSDELTDICAKYGKVEKTELIMDPISKDSRGFAFVTYEDSRDAEDAVKEMNGMDIQGRNIRVEIAKRKRGHTKTPGKYLGPRLASTRYGREGGREGGRGGHDRRGRSRSRDRRDSRNRSRSRDRGGYGRRYDDRGGHDRRYDDYRGGDRDRRDYGRNDYDRGDRYDDRPRR